MTFKVWPEFDWSSKKYLNFQKAWSNGSEVWTAIIISLEVNSVVNEDTVNTNLQNVLLLFKALNKRDDVCFTDLQQYFVS